MDQSTVIVTYDSSTNEIVINFSVHGTEKRKPYSPAQMRVIQSLGMTISPDFPSDLLQ